MAVTYQWCGAFTDDELLELHAEGFGHKLFEDPWLEQVERWSLGWVIARDDEGLVGFVNVPWDGLVHAFIIDTLVATRARRHGVGTQLVKVAADQARAASCEWLHVDFDDELRPFYFDAVGFKPTNAGLIDLTEHD
jgi:GNAT superfamily N-acetyltransferase